MQQVNKYRIGSVLGRRKILKKDHFQQGSSIIISPLNRNLALSRFLQYDSKKLNSVWLKERALL